MLMMQISLPDLRKKVANLLKPIDTNKELDGIAPTRIGMILKALKSQSSDLKLYFGSIIIIKFSNCLIYFTYVEVTFSALY